MAFPRDVAHAFALCGVLSMAFGCKTESERFPPPQAADVTGSGVGGGPSTSSSGTGGTVSTGGTASGGTTSSGGSTGTAPPPVNYCECAFEFTFDTGCGNCANNAFVGQCEPERLQCELDGPCTALASCPQTCLAKPAVDQPDCVRNCFVPFTDDVSHHLLANLLDCVCNKCADACTSSQAIMCSE